MILQELLSNYILYREVLKPMLQSWKETFAFGNYREIGSLSSDLSLALNRVKALEDGEELGWDISDEIEARSVNQTSGTRTITNHITLSVNDSDLFCEAKEILESASISKDTHIVLMDDLVDENAVDIGKTDYQASILQRDFIAPSAMQTISVTTGYESKQINSFLISETHEKREYLGEFSLTHEETPLLYFQKGGEQHDIYQESATAII